MTLLCVGDPQVQKVEESTRRLLQNSGAVAFVVEREIEGYQMGVEGSKCPSKLSLIVYKEDCEYALQQFRADHEVVPVDRFDTFDLPLKCSYNVETQRGVWNLQQSSAVESDATGLKPVCYNTDDVYEVPQQCHTQEQRMWDDWCCGFGMDECPNGFEEIGVAADPNNSIWVHRYYRVCQREECRCPWDTREYVSQHTKLVVGLTSVVSDETTFTTTCLSAGTFGTQPKAVNFVHSHPAFNKNRGGLCTCPNGDVFGVGTNKDGTLACHYGTASEIMDTSNTDWAHADVVCATCEGSEVSVACGTMSNGMELIYNDFDAWMGVHNGNPDARGAVATFQFHCSQNVDQFRIRANAYAPSGTDNSFFLKVDNRGRRFVWHIPFVRDERVVERTSPVLGSVAAGTHTLYVMKREDGTFLTSLTLDNDECRFTIDNAQPGDGHEEFVFIADTTCGGSLTEFDATNDAAWRPNYTQRCAEACSAHDECTGYEKTAHERPCRLFSAAYFDLWVVRGPGCYVKRSILTAAWS